MCFNDINHKKEKTKLNYEECIRCKLYLMTDNWKKYKVVNLSYIDSSKVW